MVRWFGGQLGNRDFCDKFYMILWVGQFSGVLVCRLSTVWSLRLCSHRVTLPLIPVGRLFVLTTAGIGESGGTHPSVTLSFGQPCTEHLWKGNAL